jgi:hypothetical protein
MEHWNIGMLEYWIIETGNLKLGTANCRLVLPTAPLPIIPSFHHSIIPLF